MTFRTADEMEAMPLHHLEQYIADGRRALASDAEFGDITAAQERAGLEHFAQAESIFKSRLAE